MKPSRYQSRAAPIRQLATLAKPAVARDLKGALKHLGTLVDVPRTVGLIRNGLPRSIWREAVDWKQFHEAMKRPFARLGALHSDAAALGERKINGAFHAAGRHVVFKDVAPFRSKFAYDRFSQATQDALRQYQDALIVQLSNDARNTIDAVIIAGQRAGLTAEEIAADIRETIGLTDRMAQAVFNYRNMLYGMDPAALTRQLSNYADDAVLQAALDRGESLSDAQVDQMTANYEDNYLDYRAGMIAQTESVRAASMGLQDSYAQAIDSGALTQDSVRQYWQIALDEKTCVLCASVADMNPDGVQIGEDFDSDDGPVTAPPLHPQCRCSVDLITNLDMLPADESASVEDMPA